MEVRIVRIFNTYGPRMRPHDGRAIPNFITQALAGQPLTVYGKGSQTRSFCYVDDEVEGLIRLLKGKETGPMNIGNPVEYTLLQLAQRIQVLTGTKSRLVFQPLPTDDPKVRRPNISLARRALRWKPRIGLDEGLKKTIAYFRSLQ
jgi:UDP-glucuronate decarboxylase